MSVLHDFYTSLAESERVADASWWEEVYRKAFPYFKSMEKVSSGTPEQKNGIDRIVHLQGGASILVDEKVRHDDYDDILLEIRSAEERQTPGWACKPLHCDYVAYAFLPSRRCYFLPFPLLQKTLANNWNQWLRDCKRVEARNHGYTTVSLAVPIDTLQKAMSDASLIRWDVPEIIN